MITSPSASALKNSDICVVWESSSSRNSSSASINKPFLHPAPPSDPLRQANRLPIKVLKMLTARSGHILHPEYLQPLPSTPVSPIEVRRRFWIPNVLLYFSHWCFEWQHFGIPMLLSRNISCPTVIPMFKTIVCRIKPQSLFITITTIVVLFKEESCVIATYTLTFGNVSECPY